MEARKPFPAKVHEAKLQQLRQERTSEAQRLDKLKAGLMLKIQAGQPKPTTSQVA